MFRVFSDGGNFCPEEIDEYRKKLEKMSHKIDSAEGFIMADLEVQAHDPDALAILLDSNGNFSEGKGSNIFFVRDGAIQTPRERYVLPGVSRQTTLDLAAAAGLRVEETDLDMFDALGSSESFITSTSFCICPVSSINGVPIGKGEVPGPVTQQLIDAYVDFVGFDWYGQYLRAGN